MRISIMSMKYEGIDAMARVKPSGRSVLRQFLLGVLTVGISGCLGFSDRKSEIPRGTIGYIQGTLGGIAVDEPRAALIGREVLASGGNAVDAATAAFFALTVTLPSSVSLGGGGLCLVRDSKNQKVETLDFRVKRSKSSGNNPRAAAIPGSPRGVFALHAKYGTMKWAELVRPAENLARFGSEVSRSMGQDLKIARRDIWRDQEIRRIFASKDTNELYKETEFMKQVDLSTVLARIRAHGASDLYSGSYARQFTLAVQASGPGFSYDELNSYLPVWRKTIEVNFIKGTAFHFPLSPNSAGATSAQIMAMVAYRGWFEGMTSIGRAHLIAEASERSLTDQQRWRLSGIDANQIASSSKIEQLLATFKEDQRVPSVGKILAPIEILAKSRGASLAVIDRSGGAVACAFSMNIPFGVGRIAKGTGIVLAAQPPATEDPLAVVMLVSKVGNRMFYASGASGGAVAPSAMINVIAKGIADPDGNLEDAMLGKRIHHGGADGVTYLERGIAPKIVNGLGALGHKMAYVRNLGYVNAVFCRSGIPVKKGVDCAVRSDPRGFGLGIGSD
jgi:gamma-glutamyltranspeptidase/glutathione hydrolase